MHTIFLTSCVDTADGQTGSGKTHTMSGTSSDPGINVRLISELFTSSATDSLYGSANIVPKA